MCVCVKERDTQRNSEAYTLTYIQMYVIMFAHTDYHICS